MLLSSPVRVSRIRGSPLSRAGARGVANWLVRHGVPTITFGAGQNNPHTVDEYVDVNDFLDGCRYALALAQTNDK